MSDTADVLVLGCGLIGTSIGLALRDSGRRVLLEDRVAENVAVAVARGAGEAWSALRGPVQARVVVAAVPPALVADVLVRAQRADLAQTYTHVSSVQSPVQADLESLSSDLSSIVGGHPLAGRELSGPQAATAGLFVGRPWAVCASPASSDVAVADVHALAEACGATPLDVPMDLHDASVARLSHLPQVASSALAGLLADPAVTEGIRFELSGAGLADSTRLAAGDPLLWTQILSANAAQVAPPLRALAGALAQLAEQLERQDDPAAVRAALLAFLEQGRAGRERVPVKRGRGSVDFSTVTVDVDDQPGRLAGLLATAGEAGINVEDVHVDHVPGRPRGSIDLLVRADAAAQLVGVLQGAGWDVRDSGSARLA